MFSVLEVDPTAWIGSNAAIFEAHLPIIRIAIYNVSKLEIMAGPMGFEPMTFSLEG